MAAALSTLLAAPLAEAAQDTEADALDVMADAVLIDGRCRGITVDFGAVMRYGGDHGLRAADLLPLGAGRDGFETALNRRASGERQDLCATAVERVRSLGFVRQP